MERFVPSECLALFGKDRLTDVERSDAAEQEMTVLFSDIREFTARSETIGPKAIFKFLNRHLRHVGPVIREHAGFIDHYIGDAVMALFSGPPIQAVRAGIGLLAAA
jgi:class 3 adenylate cyclase